MLSVLKQSSPSAHPFSQDPHRHQATAPQQDAPKAGPSYQTSPSISAAKEWRNSVGLTNDIQFVPAKNATVLGGGIEGKYKPLNDSDMEMSDDGEEPPRPPSKPSSKGKEKATDMEESSPAAGPSTPSKRTNGIAPSNPPSSTGAGPSTSPSKRKSFSESQDLYDGPVHTQWTIKPSVGRGLTNNGNTCFLNSVLQCLLYTPPLHHIFSEHSRQECHLRQKSGFCVVCALNLVAKASFSGEKGYFSPKVINNNLNAIAKGLRRGRQEDAHEFLRYLIDACQKSCLSALSPKARLNHELAETTWVHKIFGGRTRSRVTCERCGHNSDTFEACLDFSLDLAGSRNVEQALANFVKLEKLAGEGKDRYKCEKCKIPVDAHKQFTIHSAPPVLTIHLKRFTAGGKKIGRPIEYPLDLNLAQYVSEGEFGPKYSLYGIIAHSGSGPHSGHYVAFVKAPNGRWHEMNDEDVGYGTSKPPLDMREAYILWYIQDSGTQLQRAIGMAGVPRHNKFKKRRIESDSEEEEEEGPAKPPADLAPLPRPAFAEAAARAQEKIAQPAKALSMKISALEGAKKSAAASPVTSTVHATAETKKAQSSLVDYSGEDMDEDLGEPVTDPAPSSKPFIGPVIPSDKLQSSSSDPPASKPALVPSGPSLLAKSVNDMNLMGPVSAFNFYGNGNGALSKKRMSSPAGSETESSSRSQQQPKKKKGFNHSRSLYSNLGKSNLHERRGESEDQQRKDIYGGVEPDRYTPKGGNIKNKMKPKPRRSLM